MWIFGYGSIVWKTEFPFTKKVPGYVKGFMRRFWWWSMDHRGVPSSPGRVVNLIKGEPEDVVWGMAYHIDDNDWLNGVRDQLDHREKGGYTQYRTNFFPGHDNESESIEVTLYIGSDIHAHFAGPAPLEEIARTILVSKGPSGENKEYLYNLAEGMRSIAPHVKDDHLFQLEQIVKKMEEEKDVTS